MERKKKTIAASLDTKLEELVRKDATEQHRTISGTIEMILAEHYKNKKNQKEKKQ